MDLFILSDPMNQASIQSVHHNTGVESEEAEESEGETHSIDEQCMLLTQIN